MPISCQLSFPSGRNLPDVEKQEVGKARVFSPLLSCSGWHLQSGHVSSVATVASRLLLGDPAPELWWYHLFPLFLNPQSPGVEGAFCSCSPLGLFTFLRPLQLVPCLIFSLRMYLVVDFVFIILMDTNTSSL